jgi:hypothetical protein
MNSCRRWLIAQQLAGLTTTSSWLQARCSLPLSIQTICLTVRLDMDHGPMLYRTTSVVAGENAAPNLFANLLLKQGGEPAFGRDICCTS